LGRVRVVTRPSIRRDGAGPPAVGCPGATEMQRSARMEIVALQVRHVGDEDAVFRRLASEYSPAS